jgi:hypothetical protein
VLVALCYVAWDEALYLRQIHEHGAAPDTAKETAPTMEKMSYMAHPRGHSPRAHWNKVGSRLAVSLAQQVEQPRAAKF